MIEEIALALQIQRLDHATSLEEMGQLVTLATDVFVEIEADYIRWRIEQMPELSNFIAVDDGRWVGFKCGYAMTKRRYYSWLGGVHPDLRRSGIAEQLMQAQHNWLSTTEFEVVETHVRQDNKAMVRTNQKAGFKVAGRFLKDNQVNLILQRPVV